MPNNSLRVSSHGSPHELHSHEDCKFCVVDRGIGYCSKYEQAVWPYDPACATGFVQATAANTKKILKGGRRVSLLRRKYRELKRLYGGVKSGYKGTKVGHAKPDYRRAMGVGRGAKKALPYASVGVGATGVYYGGRAVGRRSTKKAESVGEMRKFINDGLALLAKYSVTSTPMRKYITRQNGMYFVVSHKTGKPLSKGYRSKADAVRRLKQIQYFKHAKAASTSDIRKKMAQRYVYTPIKERILGRVYGAGRAIRRSIPSKLRGKMAELHVAAKEKYSPAYWKGQIPNARRQRTQAARRLARLYAESPAPNKMIGYDMYRGPVGQKELLRDIVNTVHGTSTSEMARRGIAESRIGAKTYLDAHKQYRANQEYLNMLRVKRQQAAINRARAIRRGKFGGAAAVGIGSTATGYAIARPKSKQ